MSAAANETVWEGLAVAEEIARWLGSDVVGCEHLLIAALRDHGGGPDDAARTASAIAAVKALQPLVRPLAAADVTPTLTADAESALNLAVDNARHHGAPTARHEDVIWAVHEIREPVSAAMFVELGIEESMDTDDSFPWPEGELPLPWPSRFPGELPSDGPLAVFAGDARVLAQPDPLSPGRPWVLARGRRVVKAYDLEAPGVQADQRRAEADIAVYLSDLPGVVRTLKTGEFGGWLVIEMERASNGLDRHLVDVESGRRIPFTPARYSEMFQDVAETLQVLSDRGMVHRDIKPANLLFNDKQDRLLVADFSISGPVSKSARRSAQQEPGEPLGTDRYIAPEQFDGRVTPAADQYSLGVTVLETFKHLPANEAVDVVLARATSWRPEDRFESAAEFGVALWAATHEHRAHRLSDRLERVKPEWRHAWASGIVAAALTYVALLVLPASHPAPQRILVVPIVGAVVSLAVRVLARMHKGRTRPRLAIANQAWLAPLLAAPMIALLVTTTTSKDFTNFAKSAIPLVGLAYGLTAWLGSTPPEAGSWLVALVRRWERRRRPSWRGRLGCAATALVAATAIWLPAAVYRDQPASAKPPVESANKFGYMQTLSQFRAGLLRGDLPAACRLVLAARPGDLPCLSWAPRAREALDEDLMHSADHGAFLGTAPLSAFTVEAQPASGEPGVTIAAASDGDAVAFGTFTAPSVIQVNMPRPSLGASGQTGEWTYEIANRAGRWTLTGVDACTNTVSADCTYFTFMRK